MLSKNSFGYRLKTAREALKITQAVFAQPLDLTWTNVKDIEIGRKKLTPELAQKIELVHKIDFRWLLTGEGSMFLNRTEEARSTSNIEPLCKGAAELLEIFKNLDEEGQQEMIRLAKKEQLFAELMKERAG